MDSKVSPEVSITQDNPIENFNDKYDITLRPTVAFNRKKVNVEGNMPSADFGRVPVIPKQVRRKGERTK